MRVAWAKTIADNQSASWFIQGQRGSSLYLIGYFREVLCLDRHKLTASSPETTLFVARLRGDGDYGHCAWLRQFSASPRSPYWAGGALKGSGLL